MAVYKFRIKFEDHDDVYRDIEIRSTQTFEDLHNAIQRAINFDATQPASFYMSDDNWKRGQEITLNEKGQEKYASDKKPPLMKKSRLCDFIIDPHQKIYYLSDYKALWSFYIELFKILKDEPGAAYPRVVKSVGDAPKQFGATNLGKASSDFDFFNETALDTGGEDGEEEGHGLHEEDEEGESGEAASDEEEMDEFGVSGEEHHDDH